MLVVCWQTINKKYHALFVSFEKTRQFENVGDALWDSLWFGAVQYIFLTEISDLRFDKKFQLVHLYTALSAGTLQRCWC